MRSFYSEARQLPATQTARASSGTEDRLSISTRETATTGDTISLTCGLDIDRVVKARVAYAFKVFAAIYGYSVVEGTGAANIRCSYGVAEDSGASDNVLAIPARYRKRLHGDGTPMLKRLRYANEEFNLVHGADPITGQPDWLGEIFEWLSSNLEIGIDRRDSVGRIPYSEMVFARQNITPQKPHAAMLMAWFESALRSGRNSEALLRPKSPSEKTEHFVVCSHDLDFCFTSKRAAWSRLAKNLGISVVQYSSPSFFVSNLKMMTGILRGSRPGNYLPKMLAAIKKDGFRSTIFVVADGNNRRDPDYRLSGITPQLQEAIQDGFSVGVHASYASVIENASLSREVDALGLAARSRPRGNRQHWLRFDTHAKLTKAVEDAQLAYDSSLGFAETCGFRNGACFAFPPYDFANERPCPFLEIPLVIMDSALHAGSRLLKQAPQSLADGILAESRRWGWGGVSVLWHNPMENIQVPSEINRVFWTSAAKRRLCNEEWTSAEEFMSTCLTRYHAAGLLLEVQADA